MFAPSVSSTIGYPPVVAPHRTLLVYRLFYNRSFLLPPSPLTTSNPNLTSNATAIVPINMLSGMTVTPLPPPHAVRMAPSSTTTSVSSRLPLESDSPTRMSLKEEGVMWKSLRDPASAHLLLSSKLENDLSHSYDICFQFYFYYCVLRDEANKIKSHLHVF
jgi:hypothetical protein